MKPIAAPTNLELFLSFASSSLTRLTAFESDSFVMIPSSIKIGVSNDETKP
jgi:hypothetical protein